MDEKTFIFPVQPTTYWQPYPVDSYSCYMCDRTFSCMFTMTMVWKPSRVMRDGTAEPVSRDQILRRERGQENIHFPCSAGHVQDWQPYPVDPYSCYMCDHTFSCMVTNRYGPELFTMTTVWKRQPVYFG